VVLRAVFPLLTKIQDEEQEVRKTYLKTLEYTGYLVVLANIVLFIVSKEFLVCILGHNSNKWLPALTALRIFCIYGILRGLLEPIGSVIIANGKTKTMMVANMIASIIEVAMVYPALKYFGIEGVACVVTLAYLTQYVVYYLYLANNLQIKMSNLTTAVKPSFYAALPVLLLYLIFQKYYTDTLMMIVLKVSVGVIIYVTTLGMVTDWALLKTVRSRIVEEID
jgi:PST family polysaccharide transporter